MGGMQFKKDYLIAIIAGFITAIFLFPSLKNIRIGGGMLAVSLPFIVPVLWVFGLWFGRFLTRWLSFTYQFAKFVVVGFLNTSIDFGVLNILSMLTGLTSGFIIGGVNIPVFMLAATNAYFWNKFWVFSSSAKPACRQGRAAEDKKKEKTDYSDFFTFAIVVIIGVIINGGIVILIISPVFNLSPERWLNIAKVIATSISLFWNFIGFKFLVFKK
jgi:putative flippase GtrA